MIKQKKNTVLNEIISTILVVIFAVAIRVLIFEPYYIPSGSMESTLLEGDYIFATKYSYGYSRYSIPFSPKIFEGRVLQKNPNIGDVIIFRPPNDMDVRYIKRLIGKPGDKIEIVQNNLYINDKIVERKYVDLYVDKYGSKYERYIETLPNNTSYVVLYSLTRPSNEDNMLFYVPEGKYFFMGDNRDNSKDSRFDIGYVPFENFIAKSQFIFFSTQYPLWLDSGSFIQRVKQIGIWLSSIRFNRFFNGVYSS